MILLGELTLLELSIAYTLVAKYSSIMLWVYYFENPYRKTLGMILKLKLILKSVKYSWLYGLGIVVLTARA